MVIRFAPNKNNNQKVVEQAVWQDTNCYVKISLISLNVSAICTVQQYPNVYKVSWGQIEACLRQNSRLYEQIDKKCLKNMTN